jgi:transcriptional regulator with XRE-family HTH domain
MRSSQRESFGALVRREREAREIGLREMAKMIGVSPTYLSKVERDEFPPPAEDRVKGIAKIIGRDPDQLLALAGRVASDVTEIIKQHPQMASFLRAANGLTAGRRAVEAYLSNVEHDALPPPDEDMVKAIAKIIGRDLDQLLALAGVASELTEMIKQYPRAMASLLRLANERALRLEATKAEDKVAVTERDPGFPRRCSCR